MNPYTGIVKCTGYTKPRSRGDEPLCVSGFGASAGKTPLTRG